MLKKRIEAESPQTTNARSVALTILPAADLQDMAENGPFPVRVLCHHCNTAYLFEQVGLAMLSARRPTLH